jgi:hypothetical protein
VLSIITWQHSAAFDVECSYFILHVCTVNFANLFYQVVRIPKQTVLLIPASKFQLKKKIHQLARKGAERSSKRYGSKLVQVRERTGPITS